MDFLWSVISSLAPLLFLTSSAQAASIEIYLPATEAHETGATKEVPLKTGERVVVLAEPLATITHEDVLAVHGHTTPYFTEGGRGRWVEQGEIYRVVFDLTPSAQRELDRMMARQCKSYTDLQIAIDGTIMDHLVVLGCPESFRLTVSFVDADEARNLARKFSPEPIRFEEAR
ncbi:MAG: hypothetical protein KatS3mg076_0095 [Candidatus Binatia bacterium]|nr:MAG: hypothetical protein KatS3mg076_0095 [Candidatus Binatia bacterium]